MDIAARLPQLRAVILHSPILSGLRVMYPVKPKSKAKAVKAKTAAKPKSAAIKPKLKSMRYEESSKKTNRSQSHLNQQPLVQ